MQLARLVSARPPTDRPVHFLWVGGASPDDPELAPVRYDVEHAGLTDRVHFVGHQTDPQPWLRAFDLLVLPAREDAFPLVCLEAAAEAVPIVCFDNGGMPEFVRDDAGFTVGYPDLAAMADRVRALLGDDDLRERLGRTAANRSSSDHDVSVGAAGIWEVLRPWL